jgi:hypothetical protein
VPIEGAVLFKLEEPWDKTAPILPFVNIDKTKKENDCARAFAYLENKYTFILIIMI